jgi:hypothetical protein
LKISFSWSKTNLLDISMIRGNWNLDKANDASLTTFFQRSKERTTYEKGVLVAPISLTWAF